MLPGDPSNVDWSSLLHAYGPASDVPGQIAALASADPEDRKRARHQLYSNIFHQGTRYNATPYAVPLLFGLVGSPATPERHLVVEMLVYLACGYHANFLPEGLNPAEFREQRREWDAALSTEERRQWQEYGCEPMTEVYCYDAVLREAPSLIPLLQDADPELRCSAAHALAWFPELAAEAAPALDAMLARSQDALDQAHALLALGLLLRNSNVQFARQRFISHMRQPNALLPRTAAAIALSGIAPAEESIKVTEEAVEIIDVLCESLSQGKRLVEDAQRLLFHESNIVGYISGVLALMSAAAGREERIVPVLCSTLKLVDAFQSLYATRALLNVVTGKQENYFKDLPAAKLTALQKQALLAIARHGGWGLGNYSDLMLEYGLPGKKQELRFYIEGERRDQDV